MIPITINDVTDEWLTSVLAAPVAAHTRTQIGQGVGLMGDIFQVAVTYAPGAPATAPGSVVVKLPSSFEDNRQRGVDLGMFEA